MTILDKIIIHKHTEVEATQARVSLKELMYYRHFDTAVPSLKGFLANPEKAGVIAEFKRQSPSKGIINDRVQVTDVVKGYEAAGASALSVLTDRNFFGGHDDDLTAARDVTTIPILRKDFIIDPYQIYEAKAIGASDILLIAAVLDVNQAKDLGALANYLGMEVLMELHDESELDRVNAFVDVVGINNRNLKTFEVNLDHSIHLAAQLPKYKLKVSESGIHAPEDVFYLRKNGFDGFLIGENFMKTDDPAQAAITFFQQIKQTSVNL